MFDEKSIQIFADRDKIREQMIEYMKGYLELDSIDLNKTSYLSYLINIISALTSNLCFYTTSVYREFFLTKAIQKESILNLASMLGYTPPFGTPSTVQILVGMPTTFDSTINLSIPYKFKYYAGDIVFTQDHEIQVMIMNPNTDNIIATVTEIQEVGGMKVLPYIFSADKLMIYFTVSAIQEEQQTFEFSIPKLEPYEFHVIDLEFKGTASDINLSTIDMVTTQDDTSTGITEKWDKYESLFLIPAGVKGYAIRSTALGCKIFFGNGVIGEQPKSNQICDITIGLTKGSAGNVIAGTITKSDYLYVEVIDGGNIIQKPVKFEILNTAPSLGGADSPSLDEIRNYAMANVAAGKRLVTKKDYEDIKYIVEGLPISHAISILKRSDIKRTEISIFTDIVFENMIVPTKNIAHTFECPGGIFTSIAGETLIVDGEEYLTMFDLVIDPENKEGKYSYVLSDINNTVNLVRNYDRETILLPNSINFKAFRVGSKDINSNLILGTDLQPLTKSTEYVAITLHYQIIGTGDYSHVQALLVDSWLGDQYPMIHDYINRTYTVNIPLVKIPNGEQKLYLKVFGPDHPYYDAETEVIVRRDLTEYMYSQVKINKEFIPTKVVSPISETLIRGSVANTSDLLTYYPVHQIVEVKQNTSTFIENIDYRLTEESIDWSLSGVEPTPNSSYSISYKYREYLTNHNGIYNAIVYDIPVIKKDYYESINKDNFRLQIIQKIVTFDVLQYRMLTDFINLKFANTTGKLTNMLYNKLKFYVIGRNPEVMPIPTMDNQKWVVTLPDNPWNKLPSFVANWNAVTQSWSFNYLTTDDMLFSLEDVKTYIFNGEKLLEPLNDIPFTIEASIWKSTNISVTSTTLIRKIKDALINQLYTKFGYDAPIFRSDIIRIIQSVDGVEHCELISPSHNIFFNYDIYEDFTQNQLLNYSPQLVFTDTTKINISIR